MSRPDCWAKSSRPWSTDSTRIAACASSTAPTPTDPARGNSSAAQVPVAVQPAAEALGVVPAEQPRQLLAQHPTQPQAELGGLVGGVGPFGNDAVDDARAPQVGRADALRLRHLTGVVDVPVHDRRGPFRR